MSSRGGLVLAALLALGCVRSEALDATEISREVALTLHGDTRLDQPSRWIVEEACAAWRKFTRGHVRIRMAWDLDEEASARAETLLLPRLVLVAPELARHAETGEAVCGYVSGSPPVLHLVDARRDGRCVELYPLVLHELGHVAGLGHVERDGAVMASSGPTAWKFTAADEWLCSEGRLCE